MLRCLLFSMVQVLVLSLAIAQENPPGGDGGGGGQGICWVPAMLTCEQHAAVGPPCNTMNSCIWSTQNMQMECSRPHGLVPDNPGSLWSHRTKALQGQDGWLIWSTLHELKCGVLQECRCDDEYENCVMVNESDQTITFFANYPAQFPSDCQGGSLPGPPGN